MVRKTVGAGVMAGLLAMACGRTDVAKVERGLSSVQPDQQLLLVPVSPGASCELTAGGESSGSVPLVADDLGFLRMYVSPSATSSGAPQATLNCVASDGTKAQYGFDIDSLRTLQSGYQSIATQPPPASYVRPAFTGDPTTISQSALVAQGFPPRPDSTKSPAAYLRWLAYVSKPVRQIRPRLVPSGIGNNALTPATFNSQAGVELNNPNHKYLEIDGQWTVPATVTNLKIAVASIWVGIDAGTDVAQCGTEGVSYTVGGYHWSTYSAWTEWAPPASNTIANFPIAPGDVVFADEWIGDNVGNPDITGSFGWSEIWDDNTGMSSGQIATPKPPQAMNVGNAADWIVERPLNLTTMTNYPLANYGTAQFTITDAYDTTWNDWNGDSDFGLLFTMKASAFPFRILSTAATGPNPGYISFAFVNPQ